MLCGGVTAGLKPIDAEVAALAAKHHGDAQSHLGRTFHTWNPIGYATQVVAGINYWIKVQVDGGEHVHVKIYQPLGNAESQFTTAEGGKGYGDAFH